MIKKSVMLEGKLIIIPALGRLNKGTSTSSMADFVPCDRLLQKAYYPTSTLHDDDKTQFTLSLISNCCWKFEICFVPLGQCLYSAPHPSRPTSQFCTKQISHFVRKGLDNPFCIHSTRVSVDREGLNSKLNSKLPQRWQTQHAWYCWVKFWNKTEADGLN